MTAQEADRIRAILESWLSFAADVQCNCAAGEEQLQILRRRTTFILPSLDAESQP